MERKKRDISPTNRGDTNDKSVAPNWDTFVECSHRVKNGKTTQKKWQQTVPTTVVVVFFKTDDTWVFVLYETWVFINSKSNQYLWIQMGLTFRWTNILVTRCTLWLFNIAMV